MNYVLENDSMEEGLDFRISKYSSDNLEIPIYVGLNDKWFY